MWAKTKTLISQYGAKFLIAFGISWMITNGWAYVLFGCGLAFGNSILTTIGGGYLAFLWLPFTPEKILTIGLAVWLTKILPK